MNIRRERIYNAVSDKIGEIRSRSSETGRILSLGRHYASALCFAVRSGKTRKNSAVGNMAEFGAIDVPISAPIFGAGLAERRNKRAVAERRRQRLSELKENIEYTKCEMNTALLNFNNVTEPKLIDYYIYKIQSEQNRYEQLLIEYKQLVGRKG